MQQRAFLTLVISSIMAGTAGLIIKQFTMPATSLAWLRCMIPALIMGIWMYYKEIPFRKPGWKKMMLASLLNAIRIPFFFIAFIYTTVGNAVIMQYTWPIFATLLGIIYLKEHVSRQQLILLLAAFVGIIIVYSNKDISFESNDFIGMTSAIISALLYSITVVIFKSETSNYTRSELIFHQNIIGAFLYLPFFFFINELPGSFDLGLGIAYSTFIGVLLFSMFFFALNYLKASSAAMVGYLELVSGVLLGILVLGEKLTISTAIGASIIIITTLLLRTLVKRESKEVAKKNN